MSRELTLDVLDRALRKAEKTHDRRTLAALQLEFGALYLKTGRPDMARAAYQEAETGSIRFMDAQGITEATAQQGWISILQGRYQEAVSCLQRSVDSAGFEALPTVRRAAIYHNLGYAAARTDEVSRSIQPYRNALDAWGPEHRRETLATLLSLGEALVLLEEDSDAVEILSRAVELLQDPDLGNNGQEAIAQEWLAVAFSRQQTHQEAIAPARKAAELWKTLDSAESHRRALLLLIQSVLSFVREQPDDSPQALAICRDATRMIKAWISLMQEEREPEFLVLGWRWLAEVLERRGMLRDAARSLLYAAEHTRKAELGDDLELMRRAAELDIVAARKAGPLEPGSLERAVRIYKKMGDSRGAAWCRRQELRTATERENWSDAADVVARIQGEEELSAEEERDLLAFLARVQARAGLHREGMVTARQALGLLKEEDDPARFMALERLVQALEHEISSNLPPADTVEDPEPELAVLPEPPALILDLPSKVDEE